MLLVSDMLNLWGGYTTMKIIKPLNQFDNKKNMLFFFWISYAKIKAYYEKEEHKKKGEKNTNFHIIEN